MTVERNLTVGDEEDFVALVDGTVAESKAPRMRPSSEKPAQMKALSSAGALLPVSIVVTASSPVTISAKRT